MRAFGPSPLLASVRRVVVASALAATLFASASAASAQTDSSDSTRRRGGEEGSSRRSMSPQDMQARMLSAMRDRFGVTNDEEWNVISERLLKLFEVRRAGGGAPGTFLQRGGPAGGDGQRGGPGGALAERMRGARPGGGSPEAAALQAAVNDKLPEAEVKARLAQLRQTRKANEAKLEAAQEELRAVLTVRQEAMAVLMGLLN